MFLIDDKPTWSDSIKILTNKQLAIPNLHMLGFADYRFVNAALPNHYHNTMEVTVIIKGTQQYYVDDTAYILQGGDIIMTKPKECHGNNDLLQNVCQYLWFQLDMSPSAENFLGLMQPYGDYLYQQMLRYNHRIKKTDVNSLSKLQEIFFSLSSHDPGVKLNGYNRFLEFLISIFCSASCSETRTCSSDIQAATDYIHSHIKDHLSIDVIANHVGLSNSRFLVKFKQELGITPHAYISSKKIDVAKDILKFTDTSITDIAFEYNFSSSNHFSTVFKRFTGYSPSEYREKHLKP